MVQTCIHDMQCKKTGQTIQKLREMCRSGTNMARACESAGEVNKESVSVTPGFQTYYQERVP